MNGKIFKESANVFQDQARVLFDYYRKAAEQIVGEEMKLESEIAGAGQTVQTTQHEMDAQKQRATIGFGAAGVFAVAGVVLIFVQPQSAVLAGLVVLGGLGFAIVARLKANALAKRIAELGAAIQQLETAHQNIRRDYKVLKLGLAYIPVARQIPFEGKSFLIDLTGSTPRQEFRLSSVRRGEAFASTITELEESLRNAPIVETSSEMEEIQTGQFSRSIQKVSFYDYLGSLDRKFRSIAFYLEDLDTTSVQLPTIAPRSEAAEYLAAYSTGDPGNAPIFQPFATSQFDAELATFQSLNEMKKALERRAAHFEETLRKLMLNLAQVVQSVSRLKVGSTGVLAESSNRLLFTILKAPYNHYSPRLEIEEIDRIRTESFDYQESVESYRPFQLKSSSRVLYDVVSDCWVAEDGSRTNAPFGMNQIQEEIVAPIVQNLMAETRIERLKIYNSIKDQKINYLNQWHQDTEDFYGRNRAEGNDLVNQMRSTFSEFVSSHTAQAALETTEARMTSSGSLDDAVTVSASNSSEVVASYDLKGREFEMAREEFAAYMDRLKEDIERRAARFGFIEYYDASMSDRPAKAFAEATAGAHDLEDRRKPLIAVNPYFAAVSDLPPAPSVEPGVYENLALNLESVAQAALASLDGAVSNGTPSVVSAVR
jgi:outer membrane murein-binding lipoprotein Lpp